jgi:endoglucanase
MLKRICLFFVLSLVLGIMSTQAQNGVPPERYARFAKGVNLPFWFWYPPANPANRFQPEEFEDLRATGITFVRVPIDLGFLYDVETGFNEINLALVDRAINHLHEADLAVIVDLHSTSQADSDAANYSASLEDPAFVDIYVQFWSDFAAHLNQFDPDMTIFGLMNEPVFYDDPSVWLPIQERLVEAARASAPEHTFLATGARWSSMDTLLEMTPLEDENLIYEFHFYEPFIFTHQGATWAGEPWAEFSSVPYPSSPEAVAGIGEGLSEQAADYLNWYGQEAWNYDSLYERIGQAAAWGEEHGVYLICDEFGVYSENAPMIDRAVWIRDVREIFESYGIAWGMWEYDDSFGLARRSASGQSVIYDPYIVSALGLQMP